MVVAVLVRLLLLAPSSRGLERSRPHFPNSSNRQWAPKSDLQDTYLSSVQRRTRPDRHTWRQQKQCKAGALLTSLASDCDVISDWLFYNETLRNDQEYRSMRKEADGSLPLSHSPFVKLVNWSWYLHASASEGQQYG
jgi:hypothetical protein